MDSKKIYRKKVIEKPFICNKCDRGFTQERYLQQHLKRKIPCTKQYLCDKCKKEFPNNSSLQKHLDRVTSCVLEEIPIIDSSKNEYKCQYCGKVLANAYNLKRHQKICDKESNMMQMMKILIERDKQRDEREQRLMDILEKNGLNPTINNNNNVTNNVNLQQQNIYMNVTICSFGNEDLSKLDAKKVMELLKHHAKDFVSKMIEHVHANPELPEYHNVFYDSQKEKAIVFTKISDSEQSWRMRDIRDVSEVLTNKIKEHIKPGTGPYFDMAMKTKDYDIANNISQIRDNKWDDDEVIDKNKGVLTKVKNNNGFSELIDVIE